MVSRFSILDSPIDPTPARMKAAAISGEPSDAFVTPVTEIPFLARRPTRDLALWKILTRSISILGAKLP